MPIHRLTPLLSQSVLVLLALSPAALYPQAPAADPRPTVRVISGDPTKPGPFVERITFTPGLHTDPHRHNIDLHERVIRGPLMMGLGTQFDTTTVVAINAGSTIVIKAGVPHYDWFPEGGELELSGEGPLESTMSPR